MCQPEWRRARIHAQRLEEFARLRRVRDRIDRENAHPVDVVALARSAGITVEQLDTGFRDAFGSSPQAYAATRLRANRSGIEKRTMPADS
ncbi:helix-turn-helix transcriptional regulator [Rhodococcus phenolicus]|uniref:helix-turn-helix transcriptional regulator n=1 Tax=Rhodococcus phenolicus TaxID=263849 RepID=UPI00082AB194|nr:helix-turn-helix transcriptional regulator [Rhodococcus phenolicus]